MTEEIINACEYYKICESACGGTLEDTELCSCYQLYKQLKRLEQENKELKAYKDVNEDFKKAWGELNEKHKQLRSVLEEIKRICKCSKEPMNCDECPQCDDCEELCVNDENLQDIILDTINEVLQ